MTKRWSRVRGVILPLVVGATWAFGIGVEVGGNMHLGSRIVIGACAISLLSAAWSSWALRGIKREALVAQGEYETLRDQVLAAHVRGEVFPYRCVECDGHYPCIPVQFFTLSQHELDAIDQEYESWWTKRKRRKAAR